jgi:Protein-tyrosine-phosphatase-like, N-terminal domain/Protein of unknown function (DUF3562)
LTRDSVALDSAAQGFAPNQGRQNVDDRIKLQKQLETAAVSLSQEFAGKVSSEDVDRYLAEELQPFTDARIPDFVPVLAERRTRSRLRALAQRP